MGAMPDQQREESQQDHLVALNNADNVNFNVEGVGQFCGRRLTALEHLDVLADRDAMLADYLVKKRKQSEGSNLPLGIEGLSLEFKQNAYYICFLKAITIVDGEDVEEGEWTGPERSDPDMVYAVFTAYNEAKNSKYNTDDKSKDALKNSSGGEAD